MARVFHLGLDYGTSTSKLILRDYFAPGAEKAYVVENQGDYRIPSSVAFDGRKFYFGKTDNDFVGTQKVVWYHSIKMRVAQEIKGNAHKYYYGSLIDPPPKFTATDLAILTVWYLISKGNQNICRLCSEDTDIRMTVTMGIPMHFYTDNELRSTFFNIAWCSYWLFKQIGLLEDSIPYEEAKMCTDLAKSKFHSITPPSREVIRDWLRTEAEAALFWTFFSPSVSEGLYACIDVSAGTTDACIFRIVETFNTAIQRWIKERISFFGDNKYAIGMDAIDDALFVFLKQDNLSSISLRGHENDILKEYKESKDCLIKIYDNIYDVYSRAFQQAYSKQKGETVWKKYDLFLIGGGSLIEDLRERVREHPYVNKSHWPLHEQYLDIRNLEIPQDLKTLSGQPIRKDELPFILVAYGLSHQKGSAPEIDIPDEIEPIPAPSLPIKCINHEDKYSEK